MAVFVPLTAVGDKINARILKVKKNYAFGKIENIITPSKIRIEPDCECYSKCGGCVFRHISYEEELKIKKQRVYDALTRIGKIENFEMNDIVGSDEPNGYRNKSQIPVGKDKYDHVVMGFYGNHSHRIVGSGECRLHPKEFDEIVEIFKSWLDKYKIPVYDETAHEGLIRHLYLRHAKKSGEIMICPVVNGSNLPNKKELLDALTNHSDKITSIVLNINTDKTNVVLGKKCVTLYGKDFLTDELCGLKFNISPLSFYQINRDQTEKLYSIAAQYADLNGTEFLIDLYCGAGTIGLSMAKRTKNILGIEIIPQAIENAKENARLNGITNAQFICSDASKAAEDLSKKNLRPDIVIIDPPRKGCDKTVVDSVCKMSPTRVVYVSCDPETLARDLAVFEEKAFKVNKVTPVDMFPRTPHVETVVLMSR
ncbi:MAG: 23S rRNA (uracil(1939)-C(5))-methyltransferase RlmD [Clostridia bacterium]|nr:23S rRNA (uracil(1939)-C(5))-methyltransferase RlmD [Clostridia bacterium]